jgi:hypothetical protein
VHTLTSMNTRTQSLPYDRLRKPKSTDLEIHEVTIDVSLSMGTSLTTKNITSLNPEINPGNYEHMCQVDDLNPDVQVPPRGTELTVI